MKTIKSWYLGALHMLVIISLACNYFYAYKPSQYQPMQEQQVSNIDDVAEYARQTIWKNTHTKKSKKG